MHEPENLPGMTRYVKGDMAIESTKPFTGITSMGSLIQRKVVLLATAVISEENLFMNGLFQNVYLFYRMFEAMGWLPIMIINVKPTSNETIPWYMKDVRLLTIEEIAKNPIPVKLYIEVGMSTDGNMRRFLKMCGARIAKLYLGNIINIDIETPIFFPVMNFAHHVIGELDDIWVSPHYAQHAQYARALNHIDVNRKDPCVVPYVWDPQVLLGGGDRNFQWRAPVSEDKEVFLVLEPNISFQKCSLIPLMILEAWFRKNPTWNGEVVIINGERLLLIPFFRESIWNTLEIVKAGRVRMRGRTDILSLMKEFPTGIPICHQINNEYNYMILEYFWAGYPVLHNASDWADYGYYYKNSDILGASLLVDKIRKSHAENFTIYRAHARALAWKHSPYNPDIHRQWAAILK